MTTTEPILLTGASGYVGGSVLNVLLDRGAQVRAMVRDPAARKLPEPVEVVKGDAVAGAGLREALDGVGAAYYLIHSMGAANGDFAERDRQAARNFGDAAREAQVPRVIYLGGLGPTGEDASTHLRSRHEVAEVLGERVPTLVYARAAMVIGARSASFEMLRYLVERLPAMITPAWVDTRSQPIAVEDVAGTLAELAGREDVEGEVQLGGAEVLSYREMISRMSRILDRRKPVMLGLPLFTPGLSSLWVSLVTRVDRGIVRPLVDGLRSETVVTEPPPGGLNDCPKGFDAAVRAALAET